MSFFLFRRAQGCCERACCLLEPPRWNGKGRVKRTVQVEGFGKEYSWRQWSWLHGCPSGFLLRTSRFGTAKCPFNRESLVLKQPVVVSMVPVGCLWYQTGLVPGHGTYRPHPSPCSPTLRKGSRFQICKFAAWQIRR